LIGFRISHEIQKVEVIEQEELAKLVDYKAIDVVTSKNVL